MIIIKLLYTCKAFAYLIILFFYFSNNIIVGFVTKAAAEFLNNAF